LQEIAKITTAHLQIL